ncbi:MAG: TonB-dependent receptor [Gammaproteobacteria bacterium]
MRDTYSVGRRAAVIAVCFLSAGSVVAQDQEIIEEIVVTADFRERQRAELPASVAVLPEETIRRAAVQHFEELTHLVPNLNWAGGSNRPRYFQIRGIGERSQYEGAPNPSVGFLIDDIDFSGIGGIALTWDVAQVEVLRGPQGTRYGANALAGLIHVRSVEPSPERSGRVRLLAGSDEARGASFAFGGAMTDDAAFRLSANRYESNGFRDNAFLGADDTNRREESDIRARFRWDPADDLRIDLNLLYVDVDNGYDAFAIDNGFTTYSDEPGRDAQISRGGALKIEKAFGDVATLVSITSAARSDIRFGFDADWGNPAYWAPYTYDYVSRFERDRETLSQELRLVSGPEGGPADGAVSWLTGVYALRLSEGNREDSTGLYEDPAFGAFPLAKELESDYDALSLAAFGQLDWAPSDRHEISLGLRLEHRAADYADSLNGSARNDLDDSETMIGGQVSYRFALNQHHGTYVALSRGYKAGGFNLGSVPSEDERYFTSESLWNLEAGLRSDWRPGTLASSLTVFVSRRDDQQIGTSRQLVPGDPSSFIFFTDNAASGRSIGLEGEVRWTPRPDWKLYARLGLLRAEFDDYATPDGLDLSGRDQAHAPRYSFAVGASWEHPAGWFARADIAGKDAFYFSDSHDQRSQSYELVNVRLGYEWSGWTASLWARNVFDERYAVRGFYFGNEPPDFPNELYVRLGDPRQIGVTLEYGF